MPQEFDPIEAAFMQSSITAVREMLDEDDWHYDEKDLGPDCHVFEAGVSGENCNLGVRIVVETDPRSLHVTSILPVSVDPTYSFPTCKLLAKLNYNKRYGCYKYDERDGEVVYDFTYPIDNGVDKSAAHTALMIVVIAADADYKAIRNCSAGRMTLEQADEARSLAYKLLDDLSSE